MPQGFFLIAAQRLFGGAWDDAGFGGGGKKEEGKGEEGEGSFHGKGGKN